MDPNLSLKKPNLSLFWLKLGLSAEYLALAQFCVIAKITKLIGKNK
jgi:hypothetical protein